VPAAADTLAVLPTCTLRFSFIMFIVKTPRNENETNKQTDEMAATCLQLQFRNVTEYRLQSIVKNRYLNSSLPLRNQNINQCHQNLQPRQVKSTSYKN
jgi:hypothetical protein